MGGGQHDGRGDTVLVGVQPAHRDHAPAVAGLQTGEIVFRARGAQVIADGSLMLEEFRGHDGADGMATQILRTGATAAVAVEAGQWIGAALFQRPPKHVSIGHVADPMFPSR